LKAQKASAELTDWSPIFEEKARTLYPSHDPSHDFLHIKRVVSTATALARQEKADLAVIVPAAYFHDFVNVPKNDPRRKEASRLSADAVTAYLASIGYLPCYLEGIRHAIAAHSFSAGIPPETLEAKIVQDADRLDALGAIGIARCFSTASFMQQPYYCQNDPWAEHRILDDTSFSIDHFEVKLFKIAETMHTAAARTEAAKRIEFMKEYLAQLALEIDPV
jgi:uncharacterized protein